MFLSEAIKFFFDYHRIKPELFGFGYILENMVDQRLNNTELIKTIKEEFYQHLVRYESKAL